MRLQEIDQQGSQMALQFVEMRERHQAAKKARKNLRQRLRF
jgi:hypothetical protein